MSAAPPRITKAYEARLDDVDPGSRTLVARITTDAQDRLGEVVLPKGIELSLFRANPVVLWCHDLCGPPIARGLWIKPADGGKALVAKAQFAPDDFAMRIFALYQGEFLTQWSIGALPGDKAPNGPPTPAERKARPDWAGASRIYRSVVLHEFSACAVGMNPETATLAVAKGLVVPDAVRSAIAAAPAAETPPELPRLVGRTFAEAHAALLNEIRRATADRRERLQAEIDLTRGIV